MKCYLGQWRSRKVSYMYKTPLFNWHFFCLVSDLIEAVYEWKQESFIRVILWDIFIVGNLILPNFIKLITILDLDLRSYGQLFPCVYFLFYIYTYIYIYVDRIIDS